MIHWKLCKKLKFNQVVYAQPTIRHGERETQTSLGFLDTNGYPNLGQTTSPSDRKKRKKKKENVSNSGLCRTSRPPSKIKRKLRDKYQDLAREIKILWNMKVTVIPILIGAFGAIPKGLTKGIKDLEIRSQEETIQTTALLKSVRILRRVPENRRNLLSLKLQ